MDNKNLLQSKVYPVEKRRLAKCSLGREKDQSINETSNATVSARNILHMTYTVLAVGRVHTKNYRHR